VLARIMCTCLAYIQYPADHSYTCGRHFVADAHSACASDPSLIQAPYLHLRTRSLILQSLILWKPTSSLTQSCLVHLLLFLYRLPTSGFLELDFVARKIQNMVQVMDSKKFQVGKVWFRSWAT